MHVHVRVSSCAGVLTCSLLSSSKLGAFLQERANSIAVQACPEGTSHLASLSDNTPVALASLTGRPASNFLPNCWTGIATFMHMSLCQHCACQAAIAPYLLCAHDFFQFASNLQPPCHVRNIKHLQLAHLTLLLHVRELAAKVLQAARQSGVQRANCRVSHTDALLQLECWIYADGYVSSVYVRARLTAMSAAAKLLEAVSQ